MQRRLLIIALVFVAGFGVGYGITWLLVGSSGREATLEQPTPSAAERTAARGGERPTGPRPTSPAADVQATMGSADAATAAASDGGSPSDVGPTAEVAPAAAPDAGTAPEVPTKAAWEACHMHECRLDFGKVSGGISIRKGTLEHGQAVDWDRDFAKADKVGTLEAGPNVRVEVLAIGLTDGEPAAAYVLRKTRRDEVKGVIALRIGDKVLSLAPLE